MSTNYNPLQSVGGVSNIPAPSTYVWKLEDISAPDAGRTENGYMQKKRIGQVVGLELGWQNITTEQANVILNAFQDEYINVTYIDPQFGSGSLYTNTLEFYVGNRSAPMYNATLGLWSNVSFNLIDRKGAMKGNVNSQQQGS